MEIAALAADDATSVNKFKLFVIAVEVLQQGMLYDSGQHFKMCCNLCYVTY